LAAAVLLMRKICQPYSAGLATWDCLRDMPLANSRL
jgi:hypothetical protein